MNVVTPEELTGERVRELRTALRMSREEFRALCDFPNSKSGARLFNIESKDSWKDGDRERVAAVLNQAFRARSLDGQPDLQLAYDESSDLAAAVSAGVIPEPVAPVEVQTAPDEDDEATPEDIAYAEQERAYAQGWTDEPPAVEEIVGGDAYPVDADVDALQLDEPDDDELAVTDLSEVRQPDLTFTNSERDTWQRCRRKWWLEWYLGYSWARDDKTSAAAGSLRLHRALASYYLPEEDGERTDPRDALERAITDDWTEIDASLLRRSASEEERAAMAEKFQAACQLDRAMLEGYLEWIAETGADANLRAVASEAVLSHDLELKVDDETILLRVTGILDTRFVRTIDGARLFMDHKSVAALKDALPTLQLNPQMLHYLLLEWLTSDDPQNGAAVWCDGALYNMMRRVKRGTTAKPPFYERVEVRHNVHEIESYGRRLLGAAQDVWRTRRKLDAGASHLDVAYPTPTKTCSWDCDFFAICSMFDDGSPGTQDMLDSMYVQGDPLARYDGRL